MEITRQIPVLCNYNNIYQKNYYRNKKVNNKKDNQYYYLHLLYSFFSHNKYKKDGKIYLDIPEYNKIFFDKNNQCYIKYNEIHGEILRHMEKNNTLSNCLLYQDYKLFYNFFKYGQNRFRDFLKKSPVMPISLDNLLDNKKSIQLSLPIEEKKEEVIVNNSLQVEIDNKKKEIEELEMLVKLSNKHGFNLIKNK